MPSAGRLRWQRFLSASTLLLGLTLVGASVAGAQTTPPAGPSSPDATHESNVPSRAFDQNTGTWWQPTGGTTSTPKTLVYGFTEAGRQLDSLQVTFAAADARFIDFTVDVSADGTNWTTVHTVTGNSGASLSWTPTTKPSGFQWLRLRATLWTSSNPGTWGPAVSELSLVASAMPTTTTTTTTSTTSSTSVPETTSTTTSAPSTTTTSQPSTGSSSESWDDGMTGSDYRLMAGIIFTTLGLVAGGSLTGKRY